MTGPVDPATAADCAEPLEQADRRALVDPPVVPVAISLLATEGAAQGEVTGPTRSK